MNGQKILVFGDGGHLFNTSCWVLGSRGYSISLAPSAETALALLIEQNYDLVVAKLRMEDLQSLDVLKRGKKLNPEAKIMVVSGDYNAAFALEYQRIEVDDYLVLPITPGELMSRVGQCLKKIAELKADKTPAVGREARGKLAETT